MKNVLNLPSVVFLDGNESTNTVDVGISDPAAASAVMNFAGTVGVPSSIVRTVAADPFILRASVRDRFRPLVGGIEIRKGLLHMCTLGAIAMTPSGILGIVTNSHCTNGRNGVERTPFLQPTGWPPDAIAVETIDPPVTAASPLCPSGRLCRVSDAAFAALDPGVGASLGQLVRPAHMCFGAGPCAIDVTSSRDVLTIFGVGGFPQMGDQLHKIGRTTGWTGGLVSRTCVHLPAFNPDRSDTGITMLCQHFIAAGSAGGDSGAPIFELLSRNRAVLVGLLWGGDTTTGTSVFSGLREIEQELGALRFF